MDSRNPNARVWTAEQLEIVRRVLTTGGTIADASAAVGIGAHSIRKLALEMKITPFRGVRKSTIVRIKELAAEGWASSRIGLRLGLNVEAVDHFLGRDAR